MLEILIKLVLLYALTLILTIIIKTILIFFFGKGPRQIGKIPQEGNKVTGFTLARFPDGYAPLCHLIVYVDSKIAGRLPYAAITFFPTNPGIHNIRVRMGWCWSQPILVEVEQETIEHLECSTFYHGWKELYNFYQIIARPHEMFIIRRPQRNLLTENKDSRRT